MIFFVFKSKFFQKLKLYLFFFVKSNSRKKFRENDFYLLFLISGLLLLLFPSGKTWEDFLTSGGFVLLLVVITSKSRWCLHVWFHYKKKFKGFFFCMKIIKYLCRTSLYYTTLSFSINNYNKKFGFFSYMKIIKHLCTIYLYLEGLKNTVTTLQHWKTPVLFSVIVF